MDNPNDPKTLNDDLLRKDVLKINEDQKNGKEDFLNQKAKGIQGIFFTQNTHDKFKDLKNVDRNDIKSLMDRNEYWDYVKKTHNGNYKKYFDVVLDKAEELVKNTNINEYAPIKPPTKPGGDDAGGGGAPPAMGKRKNMMEVFAKNKKSPGMFYLRRENDEDYGIKDSFVDKLLKGEFPLYDKTGFCFTYEIVSEKETILAPRRGALAKIFPYINHHLPYTIKDVLSKELEKIGIKHPNKIAVKMFSKSFNEGIALPLLNILCQTNSPSYAILVDSELSSINEPELLEGIRIALGAACQPFIDNIEQSALIDGIQLKKEIELDGIKSNSFKKWEKTISNENSKKIIDGNKQIKQLSIEKISNSYCIRSLIMTAIKLCSDHHENIKTIEEILIRICFIMTLEEQEIYKNRPVSIEESIRISKVEEFKWFQKIINAYNGDDASFLSISTWAKEIKNPFLITTLAKMAVCQNRHDIIASDIDLAVGDNYICSSMVKKLDVSDVYAEDLIFKYYDKYPDILVGKMMELAYAGKEQALQTLLDRKDESSFLAVAVLAEKNMISKENISHIEKILKSSNHEFARNAAIVALINNNPNEKLINSISINPNEIECFDFDTAKAYKKATRTVSNGVKIPKANDLYSLSDDEDVLSLSKNLYEMEDYPALLVLCHLISEKYGKEKNKAKSEELKYILGYIVSAIKELGFSEEAISILNLNKIKFDENGFRKITLPDMIKGDQISLINIKDCLESGDIINAANFINTLYNNDNDAAIDALNSIEPNEMLSKLLSDDIKSNKRAPKWVKNRKVKVAILDNGFVLTN